MEREITKHYSNGEITIVWQPHKCQHSGICFRGLPEVFDPRKKPWIEQHNSSTDSIIIQVKQCPSGALSILNDKDKQSI
jgi:uncharacterized Fe-S cluster protein YjdI